MTETRQKDLPLTTSSFVELRKLCQIYVDKTDLVYSLAGDRRKYFLARPGGFGKSLLISTFEELFCHGVAGFRGLKIEPLWNDTTYSTAVLDFSQDLISRMRSSISSK
ncbi:MAG: AAA family ATPase [Sutterellaceae bacterium]|nr:AAA family ATPase [Sutterellaceae bacterium]